MNKIIWDGISKNIDIYLKARTNQVRTVPFSDRHKGHSSAHSFKVMDEWLDKMHKIRRIHC